METINLRHLNTYDADLKLNSAINHFYFDGASCLKVIHGNGDKLKKLTREIVTGYEWAEYSDTNITEVYQPGVSYINFIR